MNLRVVAALLFGASLLASAQAPAALTVYIDATNDMVTGHDAVVSVLPGDSLTARVYASVDDAHGGLAGFGARLTFDEPVVTVFSDDSNVVIDPQWDFLPAKSAGPGLVTAGASTLSGAGFVDSAVHLFDVFFTVPLTAAAGDFTILTMTDENPPPFSDFVGADGWDYDIDPDTQFLTTRVQVVPIPAALWLFGSGLVGLLVVARRRVG